MKKGPMIPDKQEEKQALNWEVPDFQYKDQNGKSFGLSDWRGGMAPNAMFTVVLMSVHR